MYKCTYSSFNPLTQHNLKRLYLFKNFLLPCQINYLNRMTVKIIKYFFLILHYKQVQNEGKHLYNQDALYIGSKYC